MFSRKIDEKDVTSKGGFPLKNFNTKFYCCISQNSARNNVAVEIHLKIKFYMERQNFTAEELTDVQTESQHFM